MLKNDNYRLSINDERGPFLKKNLMIFQSFYEVKIIEIFQNFGHVYYN